MSLTSAHRLHAVLRDLVPGGHPKEVSAAQVAARIRKQAPPSGAVVLARAGARRRVPGRPAPPRRRAARYQEETGHRDQGLTHHAHAGLRRRPRDRRDHRRRPCPVPRARSLRRLSRHCPGRRILREPEDPPVVAVRQPPYQPRDPYGRDNPAPAQAPRGPRLLRQEIGRGKGLQRGAEVPEAEDQRRHVRPPPGPTRGRPTRRAREGKWGTALTRERPAHPPNASSSDQPLPGRTPPYGPAPQQTRLQLSRARGISRIRPRRAGR